jgi:hypothetical protein
VKNYDDYSGPFVALSLSAGEGWLGVSVNWFYSYTNPTQFGTSLGIVVSPGQDVSVGLSYVTYTGKQVGNFVGRVFLGVWPLGMGVPMYYRWLYYMKQGFPDHKNPYL